MSTDFHFLAWLTDGLKRLLGIETNVDIALGQGARRAGVGVADRDIVVSVR